jgi:hypothetical protein
MHETGITKCTLLRGLFDIAGILGGVTAIRTSVQAFKNSGSVLKWSETPNIGPEPVPGKVCSFIGDTEVTTNKGETPISEIQVGDYVLAWNEETGEIDWHPVTAKLEHDDPVIIHLTIDGEEIVTTPEHPFYTEEDGWLPAGELLASMHIRKADGSYGTIEVTRAEESTQRMYNLTVDEAHTFFVGDGQWLVHNTCTPYSDEHTGRYWPENEAERIAMEKVMDDPLNGAVKKNLILGDDRWPSYDGWVKMERIVNVNGRSIKIHFNFSDILWAVDDFKFK